MNALNKARTAARDELHAMNADPAPKWRTCFSAEGTDEPTGIAPVCGAEGHDPDDGSAYDCCPEPVIEIHSAPMAAYLAALLNADRGES